MTGFGFIRDKLESKFLILYIADRLIEPVPCDILLALTQPLHGYGIMQRVEEMSGGRLRMAAGTLYGALSSLQEKGWIRGVGAQEGRRKEYVLTEAGRAALEADLKRLEELVENGRRVLGGERA